MVVGFPALRLGPPSGPSSAGAGSGCRSGGTDLAAGPFVEASGNPLRIKIYYILCSSAESTPIIVARANRRKRYLMHRGRPGKGSKNQGLSSEFGFRSPNIHRRSTVLSTVAVDNLLVRRDRAKFRFAGIRTRLAARPIVGHGPTWESDQFRLCRYRKRRSLGMIVASRVSYWAA